LSAGPGSLRFRGLSLTTRAAADARPHAQKHAVARLADRGLTNRQIARELVLSVKTIEYHLRHAKLAVRSQASPTAVLTGDLSQPGARTR
jgi:DNA-binding NarL/FixJ family response regulator